MICVALLFAWRRIPQPLAPDAVHGWPSFQSLGRPHRLFDCAPMKRWKLQEETPRVSAPKARGAGRVG